MIGEIRKEREENLPGKPESFKEVRVNVKVGRGRKATKGKKIEFGGGRRKSPVSNNPTRVQ